jgi:hypothetical protein
MEVDMRERYSDVEFEISATFHGTPGTWVGEFIIFNDVNDPSKSQSEMAPGEFTTENEARETARRFVKNLIDAGTIKGDGNA